MSATGSITQWIRQLPTDEEVALAKLHERLWPQLVSFARAKLRNIPLRAVDEEDVVQSALIDFHVALKAGRLELENRKNLFALLTTIIGFKTINHVKRQLAQKHGGGKLQSGSVLDFLSERSQRDPAEEALLTDCYEHFIGSLPAEQRQFAELYLAGYTHKEIAEQLGCVQRTSERKVALAVQRWRSMAQRALDQTDL